MVASSPDQFAAAVRAHVLAQVALDRDALYRLRTAVPDTGRLVVVGEPHGARETPSVLYALLTELGIRTIALEWSHEEMDDVTRSFLESGTFDCDRLWSLPAAAEFFCGDGRITVGHFALLQRLHDEERLDRVIHFDRLDPEPEPADWRVRDREMAERLLADWGGRGPALAVAGAFHAQLEQQGTMAHVLASQAPVCCAMIEYAGGRVWSRGAAHELRGTFPSTAVGIRLPEASPAVVPAKDR